MPRHCELCGKAIPDGRWVELNGVPLHVEACFPQMLPKLVLSQKDFEVKLSPTMPPDVAYSAGADHAAALTAMKREPR